MNYDTAAKTQEPALRVFHIKSPIAKISPICIHKNQTPVSLLRAPRPSSKVIAIISHINAKDSKSGIEVSEICGFAFPV
jgi:hypothetical protein